MATIIITCVGGLMAGVVRERELELKEDGLTPVDLTFATHEIIPKIAIRPHEQARGARPLPLKTQGPTFDPYVFSAWTGLRSANFVPA